MQILFFYRFYGPLLITGFSSSSTFTDSWGVNEFEDKLALSNTKHIFYFLPFQFFSFIIQL